MENISELMEMMGGAATEIEAERMATLLEQRGIADTTAAGEMDDSEFFALVAIAANEINGEPSAEELDEIYSREITLKITIDGQHGTITIGAGGWGNAAIHVEMADGTKLFSRERESEDYENVERDTDGCFEPDTLEVYGWERLGESGYYSTIANALSRSNVSTRAF